MKTAHTATVVKWAQTALGFGRKRTLNARGWPCRSSPSTYPTRNSGKCPRNPIARAARAWHRAPCGADPHPPMAPPPRPTPRSQPGPAHLHPGPRTGADPPSLRRPPPARQRRPCSSAIGRSRRAPRAALAASRSASTPACSDAWPSSACPSHRPMHEPRSKPPPPRSPRLARPACCSTPISCRSSTSPTTAPMPTWSWNTWTA